MSKQKGSSSSKQVPVEPEIHVMDDVATFSDEELYERLRVLESDRERALTCHVDPTPWEVELAFLLRESQVRRARRSAHERYIKQIEREFADAEAAAPVADLDNTLFLRMAGVIN